MSHVTNEVTDDHVLPEAQEQHHQTDQYCESHLINFSLLDALFPNIEL
jgi:hypothetical protein